MEQTIIGFHRDDVGDWVADLSCGHRQHVRHRPPFQMRAWVESDDGRRAHTGTAIACPLCDEPSDVQGGDPACWAGQICEDCGAVLDGTGHRPGCEAAGAG
ncbi:MAG: DUF3565 domain-containing protein [Acidimicrobiales bacterium]